MFSSEEHVGTKCPCYKCLTYAICQNKQIKTLMNDCKLLYNYLYKKNIGKRMMLDVINLHQFCKIMGISIRKDGNNYIIDYKWKR